jgi:hypothetical protein
MELSGLRRGFARQNPTPDRSLGDRQSDRLFRRESNASIAPGRDYSLSCRESALQDREGR